MTIPKIPSYPLPFKQDYPAAKVNWKIEKNRAALLIHDMQDYFVNFYGEDSELIQQVVDNIAQIKAWCVANDVPVFYTAQPAEQKDQDRALLNDMWGPGLTAYPEQAAIVKKLMPNEQDQVLTKWRYSAFYNSDLEKILKEAQKDQLIICGVYAHIGVLQTAAEAFMNGIQPFVVGDSVADFSLKDHLFALQYVQNNLGVVEDVECVIAS
ncbi:bifunctional isochorismate lyase/aryl carrier protein [Acinetobacter baylyi]|uniref:Bifunctional isochorismate lyase/aryl carrier protein n=1 Tax=Acinetobacter baylyi TaxID=202950 RepID=A0ABU0UZP2_ACIBI|nr:isochorismatase family protein [Acinetobacter baylyi]MDQ1210055.1 bifunctional isochorismate lyase/aryl carrier protein [Acinetobacter baylyi]MDR6106349.1 bifunctional isochorismate lyase/aryl carrier protein [Acinetobacter baylyi]MDR6186925.1 bifunctional isochorismate lyase/aryl carrier protein [Acinetobacter baylyi]